MAKKRDNPEGARADRDDRLYLELQAAQNTVNKIREQLRQPAANFPPFRQNPIECKIFADPSSCPFCKSQDLGSINRFDGATPDEETFERRCSDCHAAWIEAYRLTNVYSREGAPLTQVNAHRGG
jgi:predicted Zn-ribbon and HTH transcriptional regulator